MRLTAELDIPNRRSMLAVFTLFTPFTTNPAMNPGQSELGYDLYN
jgi:hypothetical protein